VLILSASVTDRDVTLVAELVDAQFGDCAVRY
jgi:hypothetical protein